MVAFRDIYLKKFTAETGIKTKYHETNYNAWYQNSKTDGLQKTGAYDIYVMDDNWVPEYAAGGASSRAWTSSGSRSTRTSSPRASSRATGRRSRARA